MSELARSICISNFIRFIVRQVHFEPETQAIMRWLEQTPFVLSANLHGGSVVANYPYDENSPSTGQNNPPDEDVFKQVAGVYANVRII